MNQKSNKHVVLVLCASLSLALLMASPAGAPQRDSAVRRVREIDLGPLGARGQTGLAFIRPSGRFVSLDRGAGAGEVDAAAFTERGERAGSKRMAVTVRNPMNMTYDDRTGRLLILDSASQKMSAMRATIEGEPEPETAYGMDVMPLALSDPQGITSDGEGGLYVLDMAPPRIVRAELVGDRGLVLRSAIPLAPQLGSDFQGIAFDPRSGHLFILERRTLRLLELTADGSLLSSRDLSRVLWGRPQSLTFAPSGDTTDDPAELSLYIVEKIDGPNASVPKGQITELSLSPLAAASASVPTVVARLVQNIHTHLFSPPSPDPDGITYYPPRNSLLITDSEVEETVGGITLYQGVNVWEVNTSGAILRTANTRSFSDEPTGIVYNPFNGHFFVSDDDAVRINEVNPGTDGIPFTADDTIRYFSVSATGSGDPEDVAFDSWRGVLYWVDGVNSEVYKASPGPNGIFDGIAPAGDDLVTHFDTTVYGVTDPECISFNTDNGHLYIMGIDPAVIAETDPDGNLLRIIDGSATNANKPAALAYAPNSLVPGTMSLYMVTRGVDNNEVATENDGELYELSFPPLTAGNLPPSVNAGPDQTVRLPSSAILDGTVTDDGLPNPPGTVTTAWTQVDGPGTATFANASAAVTTVSFTAPGTYTLVLTASDGELTASDTIVLTVENAAGTIPIESRVNATSDDAEEGATGTVDLYSSDLELVEDASVQTVGMRFKTLAIPKGAAISSAYVQFKVDETSSGATTLIVQGQAADNAATFTTAAFNVSSRLRTISAAPWVPAAWTTVGATAAAQRTPDLGPIIQEIVGRPGWASGNSLVIIVTGAGRRVAESFNGDVAGAPLLHVDYTSTPMSVNDVAVTGVVAPTPVTLGLAQTVTVNVTNQGSSTETFQVSLTDSLAAAVGVPQMATSLAAGASQALSFAWTPNVTGTHILTATAATVSGETDTADNVGTASSVVNPVPVHDVAVTGVAAPTPVTLGQAQTVTVNVTNQGTLAETFEVSLTDSLGATIVSPLPVTGLAAGGSQAVSFAWTPTVTGTHILTATAATVSGETDTADNAGTATTVVNAVPVHDVAVTGVTAPTPVILNQVQAVTVNVTNQGTLAETFLVSLTDSLGATFGPAQTVLGLAAGASQAVSLAWTPTVTGTHILTATAATVTGETDIADNVGTATSVVDPVPVNDVAVTGVAAPTPVTLGQPQTVTVNVANQGTFVETFVVSLADSLEPQAGSSQTVTALAAGGTKALSFTWTPSVAGTHTLTATAATVSGETDTADNSGTAISVVNVVAAHDVAVTGVAAPTPVTVGQAQTVTVNVSNQGTLAETFQVSLSDSLGATVGGPQNVMSLAAGGSQALSFAWTPSVAGTHTLTATAATVSGETDTADNSGTAISVVNIVTVRDVAVTGVTAPTPVTVGQAQTVTVNVANQGTFVETFQVSLSDSLGATVGVPQNVTSLAAGGSQALSFAWTPTIAGTHTLTATAATVSGETDTADNVRAATSQAIDGTLSLNIRVSTGNDDAEEALAGTVTLSSSDLELIRSVDGGLVGSAGDQTVGMRFNKVGIPKGATITNAYVQFKVDETSSAATTLNVQGQAADNATTFLTTAFNVSSRPRTASAVSWTPAAWTTVGAAGVAQQTPNLAPVIQEIVNRPGWVSGNSMVIVVTGTGTRVAEAYNGDRAGAPLLHVEYGSTGVTVHDVAVTGVTAPTPVTLGQAQTVTVNVANQGTVAETFQVSLSDSLGGTVGSPQTATSLAAGGSQALIFAWTPTAIGTHTLTATAATVTGETDTADNTRTAASVVNSLDVHDVAVTGVAAPTPVILGQAQTVTVTVTNQGTLAETFQVSLSDIPGATVGPPQAVNGLAAGGSQALTFAWTPSVAATHTLTATAATVSGETDTADNVGTTTSVVTALAVHDVAVTGVTAPAAVVAGQAQTVTVNLANQGSFTETFQVSLSDNLGATVGGPQAVTNLAGNGNAALSFAWTPSVTGTHTLTATAATVGSETDTADNVLTKTVEVTNSLVPLDIRVAASSDDAEEALAGTIDRGSSDLELILDATDQTVGMRFNAVTIPKGATITSAYIQFKVDETSSGATTLAIQGQAADNATTFLTSAFNISSRPRTAAAVSWAPEPWPTIGVIGAAQRTPNLAPIIQEIVNRPGWASGYSIVVIITGTGKRVAVAFNGEAAGAPLLHVEYTLAPAS